jgi:hypothetical protein
LTIDRSLLNTTGEYTVTVETGDATHEKELKNAIVIKTTYVDETPETSEGASTNDTSETL